ncbi:extracellular matrix regulator RemB [Thalassorhabdus alkalitolerans]|uniref:Extracellular matrix regulator RemB n=1 Tax=Thalassorhabdus alkalitolerans TaxID=2282697 RepID=A0ABW0YLP9_9BACI|nr:extracellular matrix/biofilm biosynthesis regulator RemA family protein [Thalassobacillus sp. C254]
MFIHLGGDTVIRAKDVVAILDYETNKSSAISQQFLNAKDKKDIIEISADLQKSIVVTDDILYFSPISSLTLKRRASVVSGIEDYSEEETVHDN